MILLSDCVAMVESSNHPGAIRYEPDYTPSSIGVSRAALYASGAWMDTATAEMIAKTSFGRFQIMGDNLYNAMDYTNTIWHFVADPQDQLDVFHKFIALGKFRDMPFETMLRSEVVAFALYYNGAAVYADSLINAYRELKNVQSA